MYKYIVLMLLMILVALFAEDTPAVTAPSSVKHKNEYVILLHGLGRTQYSMKRLEKQLIWRGYQTVNLDYPSTRLSVHDIAERYLLRAIDQCNVKGADKIHLVSHSLGGIIGRQYLQKHELPEGSRFVMLAPPNKGSELVDYLKDTSPYRFFFKLLLGPAAEQLGTGPESLPNSLGPVDIEVGIIIGDKSMNPLFSRCFPGPNDGKVSVAKAGLPEMKDFLVVSENHTFIMNDAGVIEQVLSFLNIGRFQ